MERRPARTNTTTGGSWTLECPYHRMLLSLRALGRTGDLPIITAACSRTSWWTTARSTSSFPSTTAQTSPAVPDWVHEAVVYNIFPDSFATSPPLHQRRGHAARVRRPRDARQARRHDPRRHGEPRLPRRPGRQLRLPEPHLRRRGVPQIRPHRLLPHRPLPRHGRGLPRAGGAGARAGHARHNRRRVQPLRLALLRL